jgi:predicted nucleotidyltransferase
MPSRTVREIAPDALSQFQPFKQVSAGADRHQDALNVARQLAEALKQRFRAKRVVLFGSATRTDFSQWSDIDLAVWGVDPAEYFRAAAYVSGFSSIFHVDLVDADDCRAALLREIVVHGVEL